MNTSEMSHDFIANGIARLPMREWVEKLILQKHWMKRDCCQVGLVGQRAGGSEGRVGNE